MGGGGGYSAHHLDIGCHKESEIFITVYTQITYCGV